ncbi:La-related protein 6C [Cucurbita argyrosperma subsp. argyrosperma]|nr:La-related protein 6C [Cucurbita argyrosperma subsp. argyrosperma]
MAEANSEEKVNENPEMEVKEAVNGDGVGSSNSNGNLSFKFNAQAPEFFPRSQTQMPVTGYFHPYFHFLGGAPATSDWFFIGDQEPTYLIPNPTIPLPNFSKNARSEDIQQKIVKQVEYQFSDMSLLANESLAKNISKDPDGYVPISVISSTKKVKSLSTNNNLIVQALRSSSKLVVSADGKKVKRKHPFTDKDKEELLSRTVVVENLPDNHSHHNLEKIFSVIGSVKTIRICHPPESNPCCSKGELFISNKLHALVEYETVELAERAAEKLNDERNWRKGLRVRLLLRRSPKSVLKTRKSEFESILDEDDSPSPVSIEQESPQSNIAELTTDFSSEENSTSSKKGWGRGRGKGRGRVHNHLDRSYSLPVTAMQSSSQILCEASSKLTSKSPRMPDGTKGFTMGRGKPLNSKSLYPFHIVLTCSSTCWKSVQPSARGRKSHDSSCCRVFAVVLHLTMVYHCDSLAATGFFPMIVAAIFIEE